MYSTDTRQNFVLWSSIKLRYSNPGLVKKKFQKSNVCRFRYIAQFLFGMKFKLCMLFIRIGVRCYYPPNPIIFPFPLKAGNVFVGVHKWR